MKSFFLVSFSQHVSVNSSLSGKGLIHQAQTANYISPDKCVYMNNLWGDVNPSQETTLPFWQMQYFKAAVCVCTVCVVVQSVFLSFCTVSPSKGAVSTSSVCVLDWLIHWSTSSQTTFPASFDHFCLLRSFIYLFIYFVFHFYLVLLLEARLMEDKNSLSVILFTNPYSSRFEIKVVLCGDKLTKLADISTMNAFIIP